MKKMMQSKKLAQRLLTFGIAVLTLCAIFPALVIGVFGAQEVKACGSAGRNAVQVTEGSGVLGMHLQINGAFSSVGFAMPTWSVSGKYAATISVYKWEGTPAKSMIVPAVAQKRFVALKDNAVNRFNFSALPAGEYFICIEQTEGTVGCWVAAGNSVTHGYMLNDGAETENEMELYVGFSGQVPSPAFSAVKAVNESYGAAPEYKENLEDMKNLSDYNLPADSLYLHNAVMPDTWVFTDGLGRKALTNDEVGNPRENRDVIIFYSSWHDNFSKSSRPFNVQLFLNKEEKKGTDLSAIINDYSYPGWPGSGYQHFWNMPVYGYYSTADEWVLRRQAELLANAGIDAISTDNTNGTYTWKSSYDAIFQTWLKAQKDGVASPKVTYMLPFAANNDTNDQLSSLYLDVYRDGKYSSLWYWLDGKPLILAHPDALKTASNGLHKEIASFFTFRSNYPGYIDKVPSLSNWGWLSVFPQAVYYKNAEDKKADVAEQITVGVAQNHDWVTHSLTAMNGENVTDRTYTSKGYDTRPDAKLWGANFSEQWEYALEKDPLTVYVTGWNEWIAGRFDNWCGVNNAFPDEFNDVASRDIEPSRGELRDHYYYQLVNYVRQYKGVREIPAPSEAKKIDINAGIAQWADVLPYYAAYIGNTADRNHAGYQGYFYTDTSGRNDIIGTQMARDGKNLYILVECAGDITPWTDPLWMNILLDTKEDGGWEGYDFVINKTAPKDDHTAVLERFTGEGYNSEAVADVAFSVSGRYLQVEIPLASLGLEGKDFTVNYSITDNVHDLSDPGQFVKGEKSIYTKFSGDIIDLYTSGDVAPGGRFMYSYRSTSDNFGTYEEPTAAETTAETQKDAGCGSSAAAAAVGAVLAAIPTCRKKRKREEEA